MIKPIFIIRIPATVELNEKHLRIFEQIEEKLSDYHVLFPMDNRTNKLEFECFNALNTTNKEIEEIKQMVLKQFKNEQ